MLTGLHVTGFVRKKKHGLLWTHGSSFVLYANFRLHKKKHLHLSCSLGQLLTIKLKQTYNFIKCFI